MVAPRSVKIRTNACAGTAQIVLSSCPDAVTGVAGCWIVSLSRARACRREVLPFLLPLPPNLVLFVVCIVDVRRRRHDSSMLRISCDSVISSPS